MKRRSRTPVILQERTGVQRTIGAVDGREHAVEIHRGMDRQTEKACERPDPSMGKAEWWAAKQGAKRLPAPKPKVEWP